MGLIFILKLWWDQVKAKEKAEIFFDVFRPFFDFFHFLSRFRLLWIGPQTSDLELDLSWNIWSKWYYWHSSLHLSPLEVRPKPTFSIL